MTNQSAEGSTIAELAEALGVTPSTIRKRVSKGWYINVGRKHTGQRGRPAELYVEAPK